MGDKDVSCGIGIGCHNITPSSCWSLIKDMLRSLSPFYAGINPYTLTARLEPGDLAHYEITRGLIHIPEVSRKETRHGDQAGSWSVRIGIDIVLSMAIVTD